MFAPNVAKAADFTPDECGLIFLTSRDMINHVGPEKLTPIFPQSLATFVAPSNPENAQRMMTSQGELERLAASDKQEDQNFTRHLLDSLTCEGPKEIVTPTDQDIIAYNAIRLALATGKPVIDLYAKGLRAVDGPVASLPSTLAEGPR